MSGWTTKTLMVQRDGRVFHKTIDYRDDVLGYTLIGRLRRGEWTAVCAFCDEEVGPTATRHELLETLVDHLNELYAEEQDAPTSQDVGP